MYLMSCDRHTSKQPAFFQECINNETYFHSLFPGECLAKQCDLEEEEDRRSKIPKPPSKNTNIYQNLCSIIKVLVFTFGENIQNSYDVIWFRPIWDIEFSIFHLFCYYFIFHLLYINDSLTHSRRVASYRWHGLPYITVIPHRSWARCLWVECQKWFAVFPYYSSHDPISCHSTS